MLCLIDCVLCFVLVCDLPCVLYTLVVFAFFVLVWYGLFELLVGMFCVC